jgi:hypothetical protein
MTAPPSSRPVTDAVPARAARPVSELATGVTFADLPGRHLDRGELLALAASVAARPAQWEPHVAFGDGRPRQYTCLHRDEHVDVWVLSWTSAGDTGWHDHDVSSGAVAVTRGRLVEHNLALGTTGVATEIAAGRAYSFGPDHIHRMAGVDDDAVSIHAYSPPLLHMGQYTVGPDGVLHRTAVSYADELRALDG